MFWKGGIVLVVNKESNPFVYSTTVIAVAGALCTISMLSCRLIIGVPHILASRYTVMIFLFISSLMPFASWLTLSGTLVVVYASAFIESRTSYWRQVFFTLYIIFQLLYIYIFKLSLYGGGAPNWNFLIQMEGAILVFLPIILKRKSITELCAV